VLAPLEDAVDEPVALLAVLPEEGLDALEGGRLQGLEPETREHLAQPVDDPLPVSHLCRKEVPRALGEEDAHHITK